MLRVNPKYSHPQNSFPFLVVVSVKWWMITESIVAIISQ